MPIRRSDFRRVHSRLLAAPSTSRRQTGGAPLRVRPCPKTRDAPITGRTLAAVLQKWLPATTPTTGVNGHPTPAAGKEHNGQAAPAPAAETEEEADAKLARTLIQVFLETGRRDLAARHAALSNGDARALREAAHSLRGSIFVEGGHALAEACTQLESACSRERPPNAAALVAQVEAEFEKLRHSVEQAPPGPAPHDPPVKHAQTAAERSVRMMGDIGLEPMTSSM